MRSIHGSLSHAHTILSYNPTTGQSTFPVTMVDHPSMSYTANYNAAAPSSNHNSKKQASQYTPPPPPSPNPPLPCIPQLPPSFPPPLSTHLSHQTPTTPPPPTRSTPAQASSMPRQVLTCQLPARPPKAALPPVATAWQKLTRAKLLILMVIVVITIRWLESL